MTEEKAAPQNAVVIKKYANRRLYNTATSTYVTLDDLASMVKGGTDFLVYDAKIGRGHHPFGADPDHLRRGKQGHQPAADQFPAPAHPLLWRLDAGLRTGFLEFSLENLGKEQEKFRSQMMEAWGADPFKAMQDHAQRNMAMFNDAMKMFNPFAAMGGMPGASGTAAQPPRTGPAPARDDLQVLKDQLAAMQQKIDTLAQK